MTRTDFFKLLSSLHPRPLGEQFQLTVERQIDEECLNARNEAFDEAARYVLEHAGALGPDVAAGLRKLKTRVEE